MAGACFLGFLRVMYSTRPPRQKVVAESSPREEYAPYKYGNFLESLWTMIKLCYLPGIFL